jgi:hypothetical protein
MFKVFLIDLAMQWGMLKKHCDRNIGPLYHAFTLYLGVMKPSPKKSICMIPINRNNYCLGKEM